MNPRTRYLASFPSLTPRPIQHLPLSPFYHKPHTYPLYNTYSILVTYRLPLFPFIDVSPVRRQLEPRGRRDQDAVHSDAGSSAQLYLHGEDLNTWTLARFFPPSLPFLFSYFSCLFNILVAPSPCIFYRGCHLLLFSLSCLFHIFLMVNFSRDFIEIVIPFFSLVYFRFFICLLSPSYPFLCSLF